MLFLVKRRNHAISDLETLKIPSFYVKCCVISNGFEQFLNAFERERCFYAIGFERYFLIRTLNLRNCALFYALCFLLLFIFCDFPRKSSLKSFELFRYTPKIQLDDGWPESEKDVFQAALRMVVVKDSR